MRCAGFATQALALCAEDEGQLRQASVGVGEIGRNRQPDACAQGPRRNGPIGQRCRLVAAELAGEQR
ncbi:MAG: hypothetical protein CRU78_18915 [Candidatus Accumulibacter phosphatis]|uniref:Uncharacterized protein n=1 Tax=Candidatus Accumulibacter phosphatis TaxID=327160 RepID=A0A6A7RY81_9PROT|nr:hypothetical protein [Candidatus Accumulibacter phosphatis]